MTEVIHELEVVEELDFSYQVPCDHYGCEQEAVYLLKLVCPSCSYKETFFICESHWTKVIASGIKASCIICDRVGTIRDFLVERRHLK